MDPTIPKVIHYCWFGGNPLPKSALACINSWKKYFPNYEIKEWNETNFDVQYNKYCSEAYDAKKYAFVSDFARFKILYDEGGVYFDTDVEVIKSFAPILENGAFMGCETQSVYTNPVDIASGLGLAVNPGLGLAINPGHSLVKEVLDDYESSSFLKEDCSLDLTTIVQRTTIILKRHGLAEMNCIQKVDGITIYPPEYFCPKDKDTLELNLTENSYSIHHYDATWYSDNMRFKKWIRITFGGRFLQFLVKIKRVCTNIIGKP